MFPCVNFCLGGIWRENYTSALSSYSEAFLERNLALFTPAFKNKHSNSPNGNKPDGITNVQLSRGVHQEAKAEEMIILQQLPYLNM